MHWGNKIILSFIIFALLIFGMAYICFQQEIYLVAPDYYQQEIAYQEHIEKTKNSQSLTQPLTLEYQAGSGYIVLTFPESVKSSDIRGEVHFFRPSNARLDIKMPVKVQKDQRQVIDIQTLQKGLWRVKIHWSTPEAEYYDEKRLFL